jgi:amino acid transporter
MTAVEEQTPLQTEVQAETSLSAIRTAGPDTSLLQNFLEQPVPVVLLTLWLVGAALMGLCALMLYELLWTLLGVLAEA